MIIIFKNKECFCFYLEFFIINLSTVTSITFIAIFILLLPSNIFILLKLSLVTYIYIKKNFNNVTCFNKRITLLKWKNLNGKSNVSCY